MNIAVPKEQAKKDDVGSDKNKLSTSAFLHEVERFHGTAEWRQQGILEVSRQI